MLHAGQKHLMPEVSSANLLYHHHTLPEKNDYAKKRRQLTIRNYPIIQRSRIPNVWHGEHMRMRVFALILTPDAAGPESYVFFAIFECLP